MLHSTIRRLAVCVLCAFVLGPGPAAADRAWALTETLLLDRPARDGRMIGQLQSCDEVYVRDLYRDWALVDSRRGEGWVNRGHLSDYMPARCRHYLRPIHPIHPYPPIRPPRPGRPPRPVPPPPEPIWPDQPPRRQPFWGP
ncbi:MAG: Bacterial SH3 domain [Rhodobacteraceae bacterium HLUCCA12]|nr:MAG: Bacterial SH3 domain [Rhodobacteraceae bacterium HLUCCA12]